jgi:ABC-2 type transport system ATP-binding protein
MGRALLPVRGGIIGESVDRSKTRMRRAAYTEGDKNANLAGKTQPDQTQTPWPPSVSDANIVEVTGLTKTYPGMTLPAVDGIGLVIPQGRLFGLLGPNGAGKTTFLSILCGLLAPDTGTVRVLGRDIRQHAQAAKRNLGLVPQDLALYPSLSARENLNFFGRMQGLRGGALRARVAECLAIAGLADVGERRADTFSGGLKRRLNLVIGLIHEPRLLVLDEPTVGIDPQSRHFIHETLRRLNQDGMSIIYTTHYMEEVESLCDELAIIDHGKIIAQGSLDSLLQQHQDGAIEIRTQQAIPDMLREPLRALPDTHAAVIDGQNLSLKSRQPESALRAALDLLHQQHIGIASVSMGAIHLEEVFLALTGTRLRD